MDWSLLLALICPLMMIFCMKGMSGHNHGDKTSCEQPRVSEQELQSMNAKMAEIMEQNSYLLKELQSLKESMSALKAGNANH